MWLTLLPNASIHILISRKEIKERQGLYFAFHDRPTIVVPNLLKVITHCRVAKDFPIDKNVLQRTYYAQ